MEITATRNDNKKARGMGYVTLKHYFDSLTLNYITDTRECIRDEIKDMNKAWKKKYLFYLLYNYQKYEGYSINNYTTLRDYVICVL